jgi:hypothetical protein
MEDSKLLDSIELLLSKRDVSISKIRKFDFNTEQEILQEDAIVLKSIKNRLKTRLSKRNTNIKQGLITEEPSRKVYNAIDDLVTLVHICERLLNQ